MAQQAKDLVLSLVALVTAVTWVWSLAWEHLYAVAVGKKKFFNVYYVPSTAQDLEIKL